jgi:hypothetical protein
MFLEHDTSPDPWNYRVEHTRGVPKSATFGIKNRVGGSRPIFVARARSVECLAVVLALAFAILGNAKAMGAVTVTTGVNTANQLGIVPENAIGLHTSVYANQFTNSSLDDRLIEAGTEMLRYSGGNYSQIYHFSVPPMSPYYQAGSVPDVTKPHPLTADKGADPALGSSYGYYATGATFPNYVNLLDASHTNGMITVNYGSSLGNLDATTGKWTSKKGGQPQEAAAWVAYANADPAIYGTASDVVLGVDAEGINWRTAGYWAKLRASTQAEYQTWAQANGVYDPANTFLAVNHDAPVGIRYWEIGNEINGNGYYGTSWEEDLHASYTGSRTNNAALSPTAYGNNLIQFATAMKAVDPTIKIGGVLVGPGGIGDTASASTNWDRNVLLTAGNQMDFGILHWYVDDDPTSTSGTCTIGNAACEANFLSATASQLPNIYSQLRTRVGQYTSHNPNAFEIHMTEFGYFDSVGNTDLATGLFAADAYATALEQGADSVHYLEMSAATFLSDTSGLTRGPAFRASQMLDHYMGTGDQIVNTTSSSTDVKIHAVRHADGSVSVMLINLLTGAGNDANVTVNIQGLPLDDAAIQWMYSGSGTSAPIQSNVGGVGNSFTYSIAPRTLIVLLIPPALSGDFNRDGVVDSSDYAVWRRMLDQNVVNGLGADADGNGHIDEADYAIWRSNFGNAATGPGSAQSSANIPEPSSEILLVACCAGVLWLKTSIRSSTFDTLRKSVVN